MMDARRIELMTQLRSLTFKFERSDMLVQALERCAGDYFSKLHTRKPFEARGLLVTGRSRVGKTHELEQAINGFNEHGYELPNGKPARILTRKLWENETWKSLGSNVLQAMEIPPGKAKSGGDAWDMVVYQAQREGVIGLCFDEAQHAFTETGRIKNKTMLDSFKAIMKDRAWPMMLILSGVPELAAYIEVDDKGEERRQLRHLLTPIHFNRIELPHDFAVLRNLLQAYAHEVGLSVDNTEDDDFCERLAYVCDHRWGLVIELIVEAIVVSKCSENESLEPEDFAQAFAEISGTSARYSPFEVENYRDAFDPLNMNRLLDRTR